MGLLTLALAPWLNSKRSQFWLSQGGDALARFLASTDGRPSASGVTVTEATALNLSAVWCAVQNIAGTIGSLPLMLYKRTDETGTFDWDYRTKFVTHALYPLLHDKPNPDMTASLFWETLVQHALLWGNGYGYIQRNAGGAVSAIWLLTPDRVRIRRDQQSGALYYDVSNARGQTARLDPAEVLHVPNLTFDGVCGYSVIARARESMGLLAASERFGGQFFGQGANASLVVTHPATLSTEAHNRLTESIHASTSGDKALRVLVLEEGITVEKMTIPPDDAQFLETRQFQVIEVCRWFNIPPHKLKDLSRATFSNIEEQGIDYYRDTIRPWLVRIEREVTTKLIAKLEQKQQFAEFIVDALLRSNTPAQDESFKAGRQWGWYSVNEIRRMKNMNPIPDGDQYLVPQNMAPADMIDEMLTAQGAASEPAPTPAPAPADDGRGEIIQAFVVDLRDAVQRALPPPAPRPPPPVEWPAPAPDPVDDGAIRAKHVRQVTAQRRLAADLARRMLAREMDKARAAAKTPDKLRAWIGGTFYERLAETYRTSLATICAPTAESDDAAGDQARRLVEEYVEDSKRQLHAMLDRHPDDVAAELDEVLARWAIERVQTIPDAVMAEELAHG